MTKVNIVNNTSKTQKPTHKVGNFYREEGSGEVYILVTTDGTDMLLSCLNDGFRWGKQRKFPVSMRLLNLSLMNLASMRAISPRLTP